MNPWIGLCLTLLIAPALAANHRTCMVISTTENTVTLQCAGLGHLQPNELIQLQPTTTKSLVTPGKNRK